jgi:hypothetical protein
VKRVWRFDRWPPNRAGRAIADHVHRGGVERCRVYRKSAGLVVPFVPRLRLREGRAPRAIPTGLVASAQKSPTPKSLRKILARKLKVYGKKTIVDQKMTAIRTPTNAESRDEVRRGSGLLKRFKKSNGKFAESLWVRESSKTSRRSRDVLIHCSVKTIDF